MKRNIFTIRLLRELLKDSDIDDDDILTIGVSSMDATSGCEAHPVTKIDLWNLDTGNHALVVWCSGPLDDRIELQAQLH